MILKPAWLFQEQERAQFAVARESSGRNVITDLGMGLNGIFIFSCLSSTMLSSQRGLNQLTGHISLAAHAHFHMGWDGVWKLT